MNILIIEDNSDLAANLAEYLEQEGHIIDAAGDGITGLHLAVSNDYDVVILDLMLPGLNGLGVCRKLREEGKITTPVLMLTAKDTVDDKLEGFTAGTDDYLIKPFSLRELHARLKALHNRHKGVLVKKTLRIDDLVLDEGTLLVTRAGQTIELTPIELQILTLLMRNSPKVVRRETIEREIWGDLTPDSDALRSHIHSLRNAIDKPFAYPLLHTMRGIGYRLVAPDVL